MTCKYRRESQAPHLGSCVASQRIGASRRPPGACSWATAKASGGACRPDAGERSPRKRPPAPRGMPCSRTRESFRLIASVRMNMAALAKHESVEAQRRCRRTSAASPYVARNIGRQRDHGTRYRDLAKAIPKELWSNAYERRRRASPSARASRRLTCEGGAARRCIRQCPVERPTDHPYRFRHAFHRSSGAPAMGGCFRLHFV